MENQIPEGAFRCPFEVRGEKEGTIMEVVLSNDERTNLPLIKEGFKKFHETPKSPGIRFCLPGEVWSECKSNSALQDVILPFQCQLLAAELDYRLFPFMPYQLADYGRDEARLLLDTEAYKFHASLCLFKAVKQSSPIVVGDLSDLCCWIEFIMTKMKAHGMANPSIKIQDSDEKEGMITLLKIFPGSITIEMERALKADNKNTFSVVKPPFYPKQFGRYSERVEIVYSREHDFASLSTEVREKIRMASNTVLKAHGIPITDPKKDKPENSGLWVVDNEAWL